MEVDPVEAREGDTPLHKSVRWVNGLSSGEGWEEGKGVVELLLDAGADPRLVHFIPLMEKGTGFFGGYLRGGVGPYLTRCGSLGPKGERG